MPTNHPDLFAALAAPFEPSEVKVRSQAGRQFHYITARSAMNRLDDVLGPENWYDEYLPGENSVLCKLTILLPDGAVLTKCDAGGYAGMADQGDDDKSGYSDAFKRACVKFGIGRYLYRDGVPTFVKERTDPQLPEHARGTDPDHGHAPARRQEPRDGDRDRDRRPQGQGQAQQPHPGRDGGGNGNGQHASVPRTGKAMFAWTKEQEQKHEVALLKYLNSWSKLQEFPARMIDWDAEQVALAYAEAVRKLQSVEASGGYEEASAN